jgi:colanic acid/amylovoran biosynthesis glycosyltransferase
VQVDVVIEQRFYCCSEGKYWTENAFPNAFWQRYKSVFSAVNIVARVSYVAQPEDDWRRVDGDSIGFSVLPSYIGPVEFIQTLPRLLIALRKRKATERKVIYRVPGILAVLYHFMAMEKSQNYAAEIVGDPEDVFAKGASNSLFRPFFKWIFIKLLKAQCKGASSISYVTEYSLQERYPPNENAFHTHYSSIQLLPDDFEQREAYNIEHGLKIVCIGNLSQPYKGCDFMLNTLVELQRLGINVELCWIGGGYLLEEMIALADQLGIAERVNFIGNVADRDDIRAEFNKANLFVLSSRQEGLPRVLIEAMAHSLVSIATDVGGVKELLPSEHIVERDNVQQLAASIESLFLLPPGELLAIAERNYRKACEYENSALESRRVAMYQFLLKAE